VWLSEYAFPLYIFRLSFPPTHSQLEREHGVDAGTKRRNIVLSRYHQAAVLIMIPPLEELGDYGKIGEIKNESYVIGC